MDAVAEAVVGSVASLIFQRQINSEQQKYTMGIFATPATILLDTNTHTRARGYCRSPPVAALHTDCDWRKYCVQLDCSIYIEYSFSSSHDDEKTNMHKLNAVDFFLHC